MSGMLERKEDGYIWVVWLKKSLAWKW